MSTRLLARLLALAAALAPLGACSPTIRKPQLAHPGTAPVQRYNATQFDPYPPPDLGPEIVGGRPIDYLVPVPEVKRANQYRDSQLATRLPVLVPSQPLGTPYYPGAPVPSLPPQSAPATPPVEYRY
jgi:hypothetical protein